MTILIYVDVSTAIPAIHTRARIQYHFSLPPPLSLSLITTSVVHIIVLLYRHSSLFTFVQLRPEPGLEMRPTAMKVEIETAHQGTVSCQFFISPIRERVRRPVSCVISLSIAARPALSGTVTVICMGLLRFFPLSSSRLDWPLG